MQAALLQQLARQLILAPCGWGTSELAPERPAERGIDLVADFLGDTRQRVVRPAHAAQGLPDARHSRAVHGGRAIAGLVAGRGQAADAGPTPGAHARVCRPWPHGSGDASGYRQRRDRTLFRRVLTRWCACPRMVGAGPCRPIQVGRQFKDNRASGARLLTGCFLALLSCSCLQSCPPHLLTR